MPLVGGEASQSRRPVTLDQRRRAVMGRLTLDAAAVEAIEALCADGIRAILLKGPAIASWLYDQSWERLYGDIDLLVSPENHAQAEATLERLGYQAAWRLAPVNPLHASTWTREAPRPAEVDLHWRVPLAPAGSASWSVLSAETEPLAIGASSVEALSPAARAMWTSVHAVQHGVGSGKSMRDLDRALDRVDRETWARAAELSRRVGVEGPFALGLRLLPAGAELAGRLSLGHSAPLEAHLRSRTPADTSIGWMRLLEQDSTRGRLQLLRAELWPSPAFMRLQSPLARRSSWGLAAAYLWRPLWLLRQLPAALRDLARARRSARR
jgi:hypothetical protein